ncbi:MAG: hypothetical protein IJ723_06065 [Ruminococcus sp.]|nr:hypothetical protein [Ruminococcus sp.]
MGKSVYSIVLSDEVVQAVDDLAYRLGTSRSNLIDRILAERVSCTTPEMRIREIFSLVEQALDRRFLPAPGSSGSVMAVKTPLRFKYKPTVKYSVELYRGFSGCVGRLKVTMRTQSAELSSLCDGFFELWSGLEKRYLGGLFSGGFPVELSPTCYTRDFYEVGEGSLTDDEIAGAISRYIETFSAAMNQYFAHPGDPAEAAALCEETYKSYLGDGVRVI